MLAGFVALVAVLIILALVPDRAPGVVRDVGIRAIPRLVRADRRLAVVGTINGVLNFLLTAILAEIVLFTADLGLAIGEFGDMDISGIVLALSSLVSSGATLAARRYSDSLDNRMYLVLPSLFVLALGFVTVATMPTLAGIVVGGAVVGVGGGAVGPIPFAYLGDISPLEDRAKLGGAFNVFGDLGVISGPIVVLPAASSVCFDAVYLICAGFCAVAAILVDKTVLSVGPTPAE